MQQSKSLGFSANDKKPKKSANKKSGVIRIIGGDWRGRNIHFTGVDGLRPSLDRTRETLFNWLSPYIHNTHCLDLFAGSGALGFEAASRGAQSVTLVERHKKVSENLQKNSTILNANNIQVTNLDALKFLEYNKKSFDCVFLDPPFGKNLLGDILKNLKPHLSNDALIYIELASEDYHDENYQQLLKNHLTNLKFKKTPRFCYGLYQMN